MKTDKYLRMVQKFNKDLEEFYTETQCEERELPDVDTTFIGCSPLEPAEIKKCKNGYTFIIDGETLKITERDCETDSWKVDELKEAISYLRKRLRKGWRVWKSENPDAELEKDEEEE